MKINPVGNPASTPTYGSQSDVNSHQKAQEARERAITKLMGNTQSAQSPVSNSNQVSPEEFSAIKSQVQVAETSDENTTIEATSTETTAEETPKQAEVETQEETEPISKQLAILARKEKALRAREAQMKQELKAKEEALKAKEAEILQRNQSLDQSKYISKDRLKQDTLTALAELGISYEDITNQQINVGQENPQTKAIINELREELKQLRANQDEAKQHQQTAQQKAYEDAVNQIRRDTKALVAKQASEYETIKATNSYEDVVELIKQTYDRDKVLLTVEEAAQEVENYLIEEAMKLSRIDKIKKRLQPASTAKAAVEQKTQTSDQQTTKAQSQPMKTLTNSMGSSGKLSARERALLAFEGKLNK